MSGYRKTLKCKITVDGKEYEVWLRPMTYEQSLAIYDAGAACGMAGSLERRRGQSVQTRKEMAESIDRVDPAMADADGVFVTFEDLCNAAYFEVAQRDLVDAWVVGSQPSDPTSPAASSGDGQST